MKEEKTLSIVDIIVFVFKLIAAVVFLLFILVLFL